MGVCHGKGHFQAIFPQITATIRRQTGLEEPLIYHFKGDHEDNNFFARLVVRGELPRSRVWEDGEHVALLTSFANTPGFTVLVPRKHLTSDIFSIEDTNYANLMDASYTLASYLMKAFGVPHCGMVFEGFEIEYSHVQLVPIHCRNVYSQSLESGSTTEIALYEEKYQGYVTSLNGPLLQDQEFLVLGASSLRKIIHCERIQPPQLLKGPQKHTDIVLSDTWNETSSQSKIRSSTRPSVSSS